MAKQEVQVHLRWMGSNGHVASLPVDDDLFYRPRMQEPLQEWLAPKLGLHHTNWNQVTLYWGTHRLTHDVLLGVLSYDQAYDSVDRRSLMPHINEAWHAFSAQLEDATQDLVVHVTRCSDADVKAASSLDRPLYCYSSSRWHKRQLEAGADNLWAKYRNNVAFMINATIKWNDVFEWAPPAMQTNEMFALASIKTDDRVAKLISPELWNKPSFALQAALACDLSNFCQYLGPAVTKDAKTMLCLIKHNAVYFDVAAAKNDFEFQCAAASVNHGVCRQLDACAAKKVGAYINASLMK